MFYSVDYNDKYNEVFEQSLSYSNMSEEQIIDAITEREGSNWFDSTDIMERA
jgi:hypothetical protein